MSDMQKDLVLSINEYAYVLDKTKGNVSCWVGPVKTSLSTSDELVVFNERTKSFKSSDYGTATKLFTTAPENWYVILKNPTKDNTYPISGKSNDLPNNIQVGRKINIRGPVSFPLFPGQMAKVIRGHALRSNQYLLARVYEAQSASASEGEILNAEGKKVEIKKDYVNGQILVIKGTEVSFYIPPTGIEVIPVNNDPAQGFVREAVTLERLEYCILKDENGNKRYVHGPEVVFPKPTEDFVKSPKGGLVFRAMELSKISGIYVKVIAEYADEDGTIHPVGEEQFITGDQQMIYYPRPEHAIISYDNKLMHHAIAIPEGEGRYVMNRLTGEIKTVCGPVMYLPDPRTEVVVKRKLTERQCGLWYPGNEEAMAYNCSLNEKAVEKRLTKGLSGSALDEMAFMASYSDSNTLANLEAKANISRGTSYTKPRTITLDNKFDGVVSIDIWTGYAVNVISKSGKREVVCGPKTVLLDYDQTLEVLSMSTGKPKTTDNVINTVFLRHENNKVSDIINVETKDFVRCAIKVSYCVDFDKSCINKWFNVENYVKFLCDRIRSDMKREAKKYFIEDFYQNYTDIVRDVALKVVPKKDGKPAHKTRYFEENGMIVSDCEVLSLSIDKDIEKMLVDHQKDMISQSLKLTDATKRIDIAKQLAEADKKEMEVESQKLRHALDLKAEETRTKMALSSEMKRKEEEEKAAAVNAEKELQPILDTINKAKLARKAEEDKAEAERTKTLAEIEKSRLDARAAALVKAMESIGPELAAAMTYQANATLVTDAANSVAPYALANGQESVADVVRKMLRGTSLEEFVDKIVDNKE